MFSELKIIAACCLRCSKIARIIMTMTSLRTTTTPAASLLLLLVVALSSIPVLAVEHEQAAIEQPTRTSNHDSNSIARPTPLFIEQCNDNNGDSCVLDPFAIQQRRDDDQFAKRQEEEEPAATSSRVVNVPQNAPNGGLSMTQPPITAQATVCRPLFVLDWPVSR